MTYVLKKKELKRMHNIWKVMKAEIEYDETEASAFVKQNDITVIRDIDDFPYHIVKLKKDPFLIDGNTKDDYVQTFPPMTKVLLVIIMSILSKSKRVTYTEQTKQKQLCCRFPISVLQMFDQNYRKLNKIRAKMNKWAL